MNRDFARLFRIQQSFIFFELKYKFELETIKKKFKIKLEELTKIILEEPDIIPPYILELKSITEWEIQGLEGDLRNCNQRIKHLIHNQEFILLG